MKQLTHERIREIRKIKKELLTDANATFKSYNRCLKRLEEIRVEHDIDKTSWNIIILEV